MLQSYSALLTPLQHTIAETAIPYQHLTERHVQAMWFEQKYFKNLCTSKGEPIQIISPGIWNAEAGPDFLKAHLKIGSKEIKGDIEIHLNDDSWQQHQHHLDERYDHVILHISFWKPTKEKPIITKNGNSVILAHFENYLTLPLVRIVQLIDLDLYPYKKFLGSGKCAQSLFRVLPQEKITNFFKSASNWRLNQKRSYFQSKTNDPSLQLGIGFARALGYKNNAEAFIELFLWLNGLSNHNEDKLLAMAMNACGFFDETFQNKWQGSEKYQQLKSLVGPKTFKIKLALNQIRPLNHPIRRLVTLVKLISSKVLKDLISKMLQHWDQNWQICNSKKGCRELRNQFFELLPSYEDNYWNFHYLFETKSKSVCIPLLGDNVKQEILINTFLPLLQKHVEETGHAFAERFFYNFFASFPAGNTSKTKYLIHRFFGDTAKGQILKKADMEQGAYQLHRDFCLHFEASCEGCPFVDRYKATFQG
jgi:hypothetical protein